MVDKYVFEENDVYTKVLKNNNRLLSGYYPFHIVCFVGAHGFEPRTLCL